MAHGYILVQRREPTRPILGQAISLQDEAVSVALAPHDSPDPVRHGRFVGAKFPARFPIAAYLNPFRWATDIFAGRKYQMSPRATVAPLGQHPWRERPNINIPQAPAYGDRREIL